MPSARPVDNSRGASALRATLGAMTASPMPFLHLQPMTAEEYAATPEVSDIDVELQEGKVVMCAKPIPSHQRGLFRFGQQLDPEVPDDLVLLMDVDVDLQLVPPSAPGTVRAPDFAVVTATAFDRVRAEGDLLRAADVVLIGELLSASTRRVDMRVKHDEYADAGIGHHWMIDLAAEDGPALTSCHLGGAFGYVDAEPVTGTFTTTEPFPVSIDLTALLA